MATISFSRVRSLEACASRAVSASLVGPLNAHSWIELPRGAARRRLELAALHFAPGACPPRADAPPLCLVPTCSEMRNVPIYLLLRNGECPHLRDGARNPVNPLAGLEPVVRAEILDARPVAEIL